MTKDKQDELDFLKECAKYNDDVSWTPEMYDTWSYQFSNKHDALEESYTLPVKVYRTIKGEPTEENLAEWRHKYTNFDSMTEGIDNAFVVQCARNRYDDSCDKVNAKADEFKYKVFTDLSIKHVYSTIEWWRFDKHGTITQVKLHKLGDCSLTSIQRHWHLFVKRVKELNEAYIQQQKFEADFRAEYPECTDIRFNNFDEIDALKRETLHIK